MQAVHLALSLLFVGAGLGGCLAAEEAPPPATTGPDWTAIEQQPYEAVRFQVVSRAGGQVEVAGYAWWPAEPSNTVILAVHGIGGQAATMFGPIASVPGYSFAHRVTESGRAFVAIDLPGYGRSEAVEEAITVDDYLHAIDQVAHQLREGTYGSEAPRAFPNVVGAGWSMGAFLVVQTQGHLASFNAVVPMGWTHGGFREEARACFNGDGACPEGLELVFVLNNTDPRIQEWAESVPDESPPQTAGVQTALWMGCYECVDGRLAPLGDIPDAQDAGMERVDAPVLNLQALEDFFNKPTTQAEAEEAFSASTDVTVVHFRDTGHALFHHLNHEDVYATVLGWLDGRGW